MIVLQKYIVSSDAKWLYIKAVVNPNIDDAHFTAISLSTDGTEITKMQSALTAALTAAGIDFTQTVTEIDIRVDLEGLSDYPYYLTLVADGTIPSTQTCSYKKSIIAVTYNKYPIYKILDCAIKELDGCDIPQVFIDYLLRLKALEAAIEVGDKDAINKYYSKLLGKSNVVNSSHSCGCHS